jgi:hypothetical protein
MSEVALIGDGLVLSIKNHCSGPRGAMRIFKVVVGVTTKRTVTGERSIDGLLIWP